MVHTRWMWSNIILVLLSAFLIFKLLVIGHSDWFIYLHPFQDYFKAAISDMAASSLRCVAIAYRSYELEKIPIDEQRLDQWDLPADDLVLLAIVGIKVMIKCRTPCQTINYYYCQFHLPWIMLKQIIIFLNVRGWPDLLITFFFPR